MIEYTTEGKVIHAVNRVSFDLTRQDFGAGWRNWRRQDLDSKAILRILPDPPAKIRNGEIYLDGEDLLKISEPAMRKVRGRKVSMIFQDPMTALNPIMKIGEQISEVIKNP